MQFRREGKYVRHRDSTMGWEGWFRGMMGVGVLLILLAIFIHFRGSSSSLVVLAYGFDFFITGGLLVLLYNGDFRRTREFNFFLISIIGLAVYYVERFSDDLSESVERILLIASLGISLLSYLVYIVRLHLRNWRKWLRFLVIILILTGFVTNSYSQNTKVFFYFLSMAACILGYLLIDQYRFSHSHVENEGETTKH